jgi:hypothetical protein
VQRAHSRVAAPGEDEFAGAPGADHLVVDDVGRHPDQRQVPTPLADDLLPGGDRDQMGEALQSDRVAVADEGRDGVGEGRQFGQRGSRSSPVVALRSSLLFAMRTSVLIATLGRSRLLRQHTRDC